MRLTHRCFLGLGLLLVLLLAVGGWEFSRVEAENAKDPQAEQGATLSQTPIEIYLRGVPTKVWQDYGFIALSFKDPAISRDARREFYKMTRLVTSEITDSSLIRKGVFALRLIPGADDAKWKSFATKMRKRKEVQFVAPIFTNPEAAAIKDLYVPVNEVLIRLNAPVTPDRIDSIQARFPLQWQRSENEREAVFALTDVDVDIIDLCTQLHLSKEFEWVSPNLLHVEGQPLPAQLPIPMPTPPNPSSLPHPKPKR